MKIKLKQHKNFWHYHTFNYYNELKYSQKKFDYIYKYLDFDKLNKNDSVICFDDSKIEKYFFKTYINNDWLEHIYNKSPDGYQYLKNNWAYGVFRILINYKDKQKLKTIVNKVINIELKEDEIEIRKAKSL